MDTYLSVLWWPLVLEAVASGVPQSQLYSLRFKLISLLSRTEVAAATTSIRSSWLNLITSMCIGKAKAKKSKAHRCTNTDESINAEHTALTMTWKKAIVWTAAVYISAVTSALLFTLHCSAVASALILFLPLNLCQTDESGRPRPLFGQYGRERMKWRRDV